MTSPLAPRRPNRPLLYIAIALYASTLVFLAYQAFVAGSTTS